MPKPRRAGMRFCALLPFLARGRGGWSCIKGQWRLYQGLGNGCQLRRLISSLRVYPLFPFLLASSSCHGVRRWLLLYRKWEHVAHTSLPAPSPSSSSSYFALMRAILPPWNSLIFSSAGESSMMCEPRLPR